MTYKQLVILFEESELSPEEFGKMMGLSGMTLRRWRDFPPQKKIPDIYKQALIRAVHGLVMDGRLSMDSKNVRDLLVSEWLPYDTAAKGLGIGAETLEHFKKSPGGAIETLSQIGGAKNNQTKVDASLEKIKSYKKMGQDWTFRITKLLSVVRSNKIHLVEKMVAYGALFYLINPFDFIPDHIPIFGFLDDFFFLSIALTFYMKRYPDLFDKKDEK